MIASANISMPEYPETYPQRLRINGRGLDNTFEPDERLYVRLMNIDQETNQLDFGDIRCPDQSVNRGKYSIPQDVLWCKSQYLNDSGYGFFSVKQVPTSLKDGTGQVVYFFVEHDPIKEDDKYLENYSHSEVRAYQNGERQKKVSRHIKIIFRQTIAELVSVLCLPQRV